MLKQSFTVVTIQTVCEEFTAGNAAFNGIHILSKRTQQSHAHVPPVAVEGILAGQAVVGSGAVTGFAVGTA